MLIAWSCLFSGQLMAGHVLFTGSGGQEPYSAQFANWGNRLMDWLEQQGVSEQDRLALGEPRADRAPGMQDISLQAIEDLLSGLASRHSPSDDFFLYLVGHGSFLDDESKFQIPGDDLTAERLAELLEEIPARRVVVINTASSSAGFINALSGKDRIVVTATKHAGERNATEFMEFFLTALEDGSADRNRDQRVSVWEASAQAAALTESWYTSNGYIATEHAILDDNGDGLGTRLYPLPDTKEGVQTKWDGAIAKRCYIKDFSFPKAAPESLVADYLGLMEEVEALKQRRATMDDSAYWRDLEVRILAAARLHKKIRTYGE